MLKKILSLVLNCEKKGDRKNREVAEGGTEEFISGVGTRSTKQEIPDPWYQKSEYY